MDQGIDIKPKSINSLEENVGDNFVILTLKRFIRTNTNNTISKKKK